MSAPSVHRCEARSQESSRTRALNVSNLVVIQSVGSSPSRQGLRCTARNDGIPNAVLPVQRLSQAELHFCFLASDKEMRHAGVELQFDVRDVRCLAGRNSSWIEDGVSDADAGKDGSCVLSLGLGLS